MDIPAQELQASWPEHWLRHQCLYQFGLNSMIPVLYVECRCPFCFSHITMTECSCQFIGHYISIHILYILSPNRLICFAYEWYSFSLLHIRFAYPICECVWYRYLHLLGSMSVRLSNCSHNFHLCHIGLYAQCLYSTVIILGIFYLPFHITALIVKI